VVSADWERLGLRPNQPAYVWIEDVLDPVVLNEGKTFVSHRSFSVVPAESRFQISLFLKPRQLTLITLSKTQAFVYSVNGYQTQLRLSETMGVSIKGSLDKKDEKVELIVGAEKPCQVMVYWPKEWTKPSQVKVNKSLVKFQEIKENGECFLLISLTQGEHHLFLL